MMILLIPIILIALSAGIMLYAVNLLDRQNERDYEIYELMEQCASASTRKQKQNVLRRLDRLCTRDLALLADSKNSPDVLSRLMINSASLHLLKGTKQERKMLKDLASLYKYVLDGRCSIEECLMLLEGFKTDNLDLYRIVQAMKSQFSNLNTLSV